MLKKIFLILPYLFLNTIIFSQEIKIMTWNIFMVPPLIFKSCQTERASLIAEYIQQINPDILVLDETFMKSTRTIIYDKLQISYPFSSTITKPGFFKTNSGIWILSKYPISNQHAITYKKKKGSDIFAKKGAIFVNVSLQSKTIQIIGTHAQSLNKNNNTRKKQFLQLKQKMLDKYFKDSIPQFIIGDLNCNYYDSTEYQLLQTSLDVLPINFTGEKYSWNGIENDLANTFSDHTLETLDYILLRKQHQNIAKITSTEILKPYSKEVYCTKKFHYLSDHHPVISTVELK